MVKSILFYILILKMYRKILFSLYHFRKGKFMAQTL